MYAKYEDCNPQRSTDTKWQIVWETGGRYINMNSESFGYKRIQTFASTQNSKQKHSSVSIRVFTSCNITAYWYIGHSIRLRGSRLIQFVREPMVSHPNTSLIYNESERPYLDTAFELFPQLVRDIHAHAHVHRSMIDLHLFSLSSLLKTHH